jgi:hypothetical protein
MDSESFFNNMKTDSNEIDLLIDQTYFSTGHQSVEKTYSKIREILCLTQGEKFVFSGQEMSKNLI